MGVPARASGRGRSSSGARGSDVSGSGARLGRRVVPRSRQIYEGLMRLVPGTARRRARARDAAGKRSSMDGKTWTFFAPAEHQVPRRDAFNARPSARTSTAGTTSRARSRTPGDLLLAGDLRRVQDGEQGRPPAHAALLELPAVEAATRHRQPDQAVIGRSSASLSLSAFSMQSPTAMPSTAPTRPSSVAASSIRPARTGSSTRPAPARSGSSRGRSARS